MPLVKPTVGAAGWGTTLNTALDYLAAGGGSVFSVKDPAYGAVGDGINDDTAEIQAAIDACEASGLATGILYFPAGTYKISAALSIPYAYGWEIRGDGKGLTNIIQHTTNVPIFTVESDPYLHTFRMVDLYLAYNVQQTSSNTNSHGVLFTGDANSQAFNILFERMWVKHCYRAFTFHIATHHSTPWGLRFRDITATSLPGSTIWIGDSAGKPNIGLENIYIANTGTAVTGVEPAILITSGEIRIEGLDIEGWSYRHMELSGHTSPVLIDNYHMENSTIPDDVWTLNYIANGGFIARGVSCSATINQSYYRTAVFLVDIGGIGKIDGILGGFTYAQGGSKCYPLAIDPGGTGTVSGVQGNFTDSSPIDLYNATSKSLLRQVNTQSYPAQATKTSNYTAARYDEILLVDATAGAVTITLPAAADYTGKQYTIKRTSAANNVVVDANASETIDGATTKTITTQYGFLTILCDGTGWQIVGTGGTIT